MFENLMGFFARQKSSDVAKDRMRLLLELDRQKTSVVSEDVIEKIREEIMAVISKYVEIDMEGLDIKIERSKDDTGRIMSAVVANIPINKTGKTNKNGGNNNNNANKGKKK